MAEGARVRQSLRIGVFEFRRTIRALWQDKAQFGLILCGAVLLTLIPVLFSVTFAETIRGLERLPVVDQTRGTVAFFWLLAVFFVGQRVISMRARIEAEPFILTSVSTRAAAGGLIVAEVLRIGVYLAGPVFVLTVIGVVLLDSLASLVFVPVTALLFVMTAVVVGSACGYAIALLVATSPFVARHKTAFGIGGSILLMGVLFLFMIPEFGVEQSLLAWLPVGWFTDLAMIGTGLVGTPLRWNGALLTTAVILLVGGTIVERETSTLWVIEPITVDTEKSASGSKRRSKRQNQSATTARSDAFETTVTTLLAPRFLPTPTRRVAQWVLLRTRRDPKRLLWFLMPVFAIYSGLANVLLHTDSIHTVAAPLFAVMIPWAVGTLFAINPFGDEGAMLPVTLTAVPGRQYVHGLIVPALLLGLPVVTLVTALATFISPYTLGERFGLLVVGIYLTCIAVVIAPAIGMTLPRFSAFSIGQSRTVVPPRMTAVATHGVLIVLPGTVLASLLLVPETTRAVLAGLFGFLPAALLELLAESTGGVFTIPADWFAAVGELFVSLDITSLRAIGGGTIVFGGPLVAALAYRYAIAQFEGYTLS